MHDISYCYYVTQAVSEDAKLKMFRESLKLFINHFLLKQAKSAELEFVKAKIELAERGLMAGNSTFKL